VHQEYCLAYRSNLSLKNWASCNCRGRASNGIYTTMQRYIQLCYTHMNRLSLGTQSGTTVFVGTTRHTFQRSKNVQHIWPDTQSQSSPSVAERDQQTCQKWWDYLSQVAVTELSGERIWWCLIWKKQSARHSLCLFRWPLDLNWVVQILSWSLCSPSREGLCGTEEVW
jgi:hypothetical protein